MATNEPTPTVSPQAAASFQQTAAQYGVNPDATLAAHGVKLQKTGAPSGANAEQITGGSGQKGAQVDLSPENLPRMTDAQTVAMGEQLLRHWTGPREVLEEALKRAGLEPVPDVDRNDQRND